MNVEGRKKKQLSKDPEKKITCQGFGANRAEGPLAALSVTRLGFNTVARRASCL